MNYNVSSSEVLEKLNEEFKRKYCEDFDAKAVMNKFFEHMMEYCIENSAFRVSNLGNFTMFKVFSTRTNKNMVRFKFKPSSTLIKKLNSDQYILENIPVSDVKVFGSDAEKRVEGKREKANENYKLNASIALSHEKEKARERQSKNALLELINNTR